MASREQADPSSVNLQLWYDTILVADLLNVVVHQGTWFGHYRFLGARDRESEKRASAIMLGFAKNGMNAFSGERIPTPANSINSTMSSTLDCGACLFQMAAS